MSDHVGRPVRVLESFPSPRPTTNPYIVMLARSLAAEPGIEMRTFTWRRALLGRYDVFHAHWPEILVSGHSPLKAAVRQLLTVLLLLRLQMTRTPIVRTVHNLELPSGISRVQRAILRAFDRRTTLRIRLNDTTPMLDGREYDTILHGHYRDWFAPFAKQEASPGALAFFGLIRRYKNVPGLLTAFLETSGDLRLTIAGSPTSEELAGAIQALAAHDDRVSLTFAFLSESELVEVVTGARLVVLPYLEMHNSGGVLSALSLDRPVLVPESEANASLATEVGPGWVLQYAGELTAATIERAMRAVANERSRRPDLSRRGWEDTGALHERAFLRAIAVRRGRAPGAAATMLASASEASFQDRRAVGEHVTE